MARINPISLNESFKCYVEGHLMRIWKKFKISEEDKYPILTIDLEESSMVDVIKLCDVLGLDIDLILKHYMSV